MIRSVMSRELQFTARAIVLFRRAVLLAGCSLFFDTACSTQELGHADLAKGCVLNTDCNAPLVCSSGRCHAECRTTDDCSHGERCITSREGSVCQLPQESKCKFTSECGAPLVCALDGACRNQCRGDRDCLSGQLCASGGVCAEQLEVGDGRHLLGATRDAAAAVDASFSGGSGGAPATNAGVDASGSMVADASSHACDTCSTTCAAGRCLVTLASGQNAPFDIAVDSANVYWSSLHGGTIVEMPRAGGTPLTLASGQRYPEGIAIDGASVYWTTATQGGSVIKTPISGGTETTLASQQSSPNAVAVDATTVYWTTNVGGTVMKMPLEGGTPTTLASEQGNPDKMAVDATSVYWTNDDGTVMRLTPK